jgi:hypothetical protein
MKSIKFVIVKTMILLFFSFSTGYLSFSQTNAVPDVEAISGNNVQFIAMDNDNLVFELRFTALPPKGCILRIIDDTGVELFVETISGAIHLKRYKVERNGMRSISFKANGKGFLFNQSFNIKTEEKILVIPN